jgi:hypothetical protein
MLMRHEMALIVYVLISACACTTQSGSTTAPSNPPPPEISMAASSWDFRFSPGMPEHPSGLPVGWFFDFPVYSEVSTVNCNATNCPSVHYLTTASSMPLAGKTLAVTVLISVSGSPIFQSALEPGNTCGGPATVRLFFQRADDPGTLEAEFHRWWSVGSYVLSPGSGTLSVPMMPELWSSVLGRRGDSSAAATEGFNAALANLGHVGMTFGGGCFFGHGVNISSGTARFTVTSFGAN